MPEPSGIRAGTSRRTCPEPPEPAPEHPGTHPEPYRTRPEPARNLPEHEEFIQKRNLSEPASERLRNLPGTCRNLLPEPFRAWVGTRAGTSSATFRNLHRNLLRNPCWNLPQPVPEPFGTFRNLRNLRNPAGTHPQPSGTRPEPAPAPPPPLTAEDPKHSAVGEKRSLLAGNAFSRALCRGTVVFGRQWPSVCFHGNTALARTY